MIVEPESLIGANIKGIMEQIKGTSTLDTYHIFHYTDGKILAHLLLLIDSSITYSIPFF